MNPALIEALQSVARAAEAAGYGQKNAVYQQAADHMGMSLATLHRKLKEVVIVKTRKQRSDAGTSNLSFDEAKIISAYMVESARKNEKRLASVKSALEVLRANNEIRAECVDKNTGEVRLMSVDAVSRALYKFRLHPEQLNKPTAKMTMASLHPNHVWQIDPSLCVLYYLPTKKGEALQVMSEKEFYKNKPENIIRVEKERVWRYVISDHASGWIYVHYVPGAETGKNLVDSFIAATQKRHPKDPVHGIPTMVMVDPGSANTGAVFKNLCEALSIHLQVNQPGQPWAKGQVEKANDIVECEFEHRIKMMDKPPTCIEELNVSGWAWMRWYNSTQIHSRTKETRYSAWARITEAQLIIAPPAAVMRELSYSAPEPRVVTAQLTIEFKGKEYSVKAVPGVEVKERVLVTINPWRDDGSIQLITVDKDGKKIIHVIEPIKKDDFGFPIDAPVFGEDYKRHADSATDKNRKAVERLVMEADTDEEAKQNRKAKKVPFGGRIDPMKNITDTALVDYLPKRGTASDVVAPTMEFKPLTHAAAAKKLIAKMGNTWKGSDHFAWLKQRYPDGVPEDELDGIVQQLQQVQAAPLRLIK
jgi:hypothetical protein